MAAALLPSVHVFGSAAVPEALSSMSNSFTQRRRPSVKWDLGSDYEDDARETTGPGVDFRRERLESPPDLGLRTQPQILFLRPRPAVPKLLFRCGSRVRSSRPAGTPKGVRAFRPTVPKPCPHPTSACSCVSDPRNIGIFQTLANS